MTAQDILLDTNGLQINSGDLVVNDSDQQHIEHILRASKGQFAQFPTIGVGMQYYVAGSISPQALKKDISLQLRVDNFKVRTVTIDSDFRINIDAERTK